MLEPRACNMRLDIANVEIRIAEQGLVEPFERPATQRRGAAIGQAAIIVISVGQDQPRLLAQICGQRRAEADKAAVVEVARSEEHTSELQSLMRISYAVFCLKKKTNTRHTEPDNAMYVYKK